MTTGQMTAKQALIEAVNGMTEEEAEDLLDFLELQADPGDLTDEELAAVNRARAEYDRGEYVTAEEFEAELARRRAG